MPNLVSTLLQSDSIMNRESAWTPAGGSMVYRNLVAGETVSEGSALSLSPFFSGVRNISEDVGKLPAYAVSYVNENDKYREDTHVVTKLFDEEPNSYQSPLFFRAQMTGWKITWGNAYAEIERDARMNPVALHPIHPGRVWPVWNKEQQRVIYRVLACHTENMWRSTGYQYEVDQDNMLHLRGFGSDPLVGYSIIKVAAQSISMSLAAERFGAATLKNMGAVTSVIKHPGAMKQQERDNFVASFDAAYKGSTRAGGWILLEDGMSYEAINLSPEDMQLLQSRIVQTEEICRWLRISPAKIQHLGKVSYNSLEQQDNEYAQDSLQAHITEWEQEVQRKLFRSDESNMRLFHNMNARLRGDIKAQTEHLTKVWQVAGYSINDVLRFLGRNSIGSIGEKRFVPVNMQELKEDMTPARAKQAPEPKSNQSTFTLARSRAIVSVETKRIKSKCEKAVERINTKHANDPIMRAACLEELYVGLRCELLANLQPIWITWFGSAECLAEIIEPESRQEIAFDEITDTLAHALLGETSHV